MAVNMAANRDICIYQLIVQLQRVWSQFLQFEIRESILRSQNSLEILNFRTEDIKLLVETDIC